MNLVWPSLQYLPSYVTALERGWTYDNIRGDAQHHASQWVAEPARGAEIPGVAGRRLSRLKPAPRIAKKADLKVRLYVMNAS